MVSPWLVALPAVHSSCASAYTTVCVHWMLEEKQNEAAGRKTEDVYGSSFARELLGRV